jgi:hypothetical protein
MKPSMKNVLSMLAALSASFSRAAGHRLSAAALRSRFKTGSPDFDRFDHVEGFAQNLRHGRRLKPTMNVQKLHRKIDEYIGMRELVFKSHVW